MTIKNLLQQPGCHTFFLLRLHYPAVLVWDTASLGVLLAVATALFTTAVPLSCTDTGQYAKQAAFWGFYSCLCFLLLAFWAAAIAFQYKWLKKAQGSFPGQILAYLTAALLTIGVVFLIISLFFAAAPSQEPKRTRAQVISIVAGVLCVIAPLGMWTFGIEAWQASINLPSEGANWGGGEWSGQRQIPPCVRHAVNANELASADAIRSVIVHGDGDSHIHLTGHAHKGSLGQLH
jgi:hypothetical protein